MLENYKYHDKFLISMLLRKTILSSLLFFLFILSLSAQNISVKSFYSAPDDMSARVTAPIIDQNGDKCALIKIKTTQMGLTFEGDMMGIEKTVQKVAEVWVYVPFGAKKISIAHGKLGRLDNYIYTENIKEASVYIMELTTGKVTTIVEDVEIPMQWFTISSTPDGADVYIDEQLVGSTPYQKKIQVGTYNYRLEKAMYHNSAGVLSLKESGKEEVNLVLKPSFGFVNIKSTPESGASLEIDGRPVSEKTPFKSESLLSGEHRVVLKKVMFQPKTVNFEIKDGETTHLDVELLPNFAEVTIESSPSADIYIDDEKKGTSAYSGRLLPGLHSFEARKAKHTSAKKQLEFVAGQKQTISLIPSPKTGSVDVISTPFGAGINIDGKSYGTTPNTIDNLLIGDYSLELSKAGYGTVLKTISIGENNTAEINESLPSGKEVSINSTPSGANVYKGETFMGTTPLKTTLAFGTYKIRVTKEGETDTKQIKIAQNGEINFSFNVQKIKSKVKASSKEPENSYNIYSNLKGKKRRAMKAKLTNMVSDYTDKAVAYYVRKDFAASLEAFEKVLEIENSEIFKEDNLSVDTAIIFNAGLTAHKAGKLKAAANYYMTAIKYKYGGAKTYAFLTQVLIDNNKEKEALMYFHKGCKIYPTDPFMFDELINFYMLRDEADLALQFLDKLISLDPQNGSYYRTKGTMYEKINELSKAQEMYRVALEKDAKN